MHTTTNKTLKLWRFCYQSFGDWNLPSSQPWSIHEFVTGEIVRYLYHMLQLKTFSFFSCMALPFYNIHFEAFNRWQAHIFITQTLITSKLDVKYSSFQVMPRSSQVTYRGDIPSLKAQGHIEINYKYTAPPVPHKNWEQWQQSKGYWSFEPCIH